MGWAKVRRLLEAARCSAQAAQADLAESSLCALLPVVQLAEARIG
jgi:hypothetical protein